MHFSLQEPGDGMVSRFPTGMTKLHDNERPGGASQPEAAPARELLTAEELRIVRTNIAAATVRLPVTPEMAWAVPPLIKRIQPLAPGVQSTSGALRALIRSPELDAHFAKAFTDSGFLWCDQVIGRARWKYDITDMMAKRSDRSDSEVLAHCGMVLSRHRMKQPFDWDAVLTELEMLTSWFPELRTIQLLDQLYTRLNDLHVKSVLAAQGWLDWRASQRRPFAFLGAHDA
jgi:hypothetical protein